jgi:hypothetical protein
MTVELLVSWDVSTAIASSWLAIATELLGWGVVSITVRQHKILVVRI